MVGIGSFLRRDTPPRLGGETVRHLPPSVTDGEFIGSAGAAYSRPAVDGQLEVPPGPLNGVPVGGSLLVEVRFRLAHQTYRDFATATGRSLGN